MIFDYETLKIIWWLFLGVLLLGFALSDGFDMGIGTLLPFIAKNDKERRVLINVIGPTWEGNQVWLILAAGAVFAAWPLVYATAFSSLFFAMLLLLFALFFRPVGFDYRSKLKNQTWRNAWDWALFCGSAIPAFLFGVVFGNLFLGIPFHFNDELRLFYTGSFWQLLHPFALLSGFVSLAMLIMHGATYLQLRTEDIILQRSRKVTCWIAVIYIVLFVFAGVWSIFLLPSYHLTFIPDVNQTLNPLMKLVEITEQGWLYNYKQHSWMLLAPIGGTVGGAFVILFTLGKHPKFAFMFSSTAIIGVILTAGFTLFPFLLPSSTHPSHSLTIWDASSSQMTLMLMFWAVVFFLPLIILYTRWVYKVLRGTLTVKTIEDNQQTMY